MDRLEKWNSEFGKESVEASIFEAWELMFTTQLLESKIKDPALSQSLRSQGVSEPFIWQ